MNKKLLNKNTNKNKRKIKTKKNNKSLKGGIKNQIPKFLEKNKQKYDKLINYINNINNSKPKKQKGGLRQNELNLMLEDNSVEFLNTDINHSSLSGILLKGKLIEPYLSFSNIQIKERIDNNGNNYLDTEFKTSNDVIIKIIYLSKFHKSNYVMEHNNIKKQKSADQINNFVKEVYLQDAIFESFFDTNSNFYPYYFGKPFVPEVLKIDIISDQNEKLNFMNSLMNNKMTNNNNIHKELLESLINSKTMETNTNAFDDFDIGIIMMENIKNKTLYNYEKSNHSDINKVLNNIRTEALLLNVGMGLTHMDLHMSNVIINTNINENSNDDYNYNFGNKPLIIDFGRTIINRFEIEEEMKGINKNILVNERMSIDIIKYLLKHIINEEKIGNPGPDVGPMKILEYKDDNDIKEIIDNLKKYIEINTKIQNHNNNKNVINNFNHIKFTFLNNKLNLLKTICKMNKTIVNEKIPLINENDKLFIENLEDDCDSYKQNIKFNINGQLISLLEEPQPQIQLSPMNNTTNNNKSRKRKRNSNSNNNNNKSRKKRRINNGSSQLVVSSLPSYVDGFYDPIFTLSPPPYS